MTDPQTSPAAAPTGGSPLHAAVIGARDLAASTAFYRDLIGLEVVGEGPLRGSAFRGAFHLPAGSQARYAALANRGDRVGRIVLIAFEAQDRKPIRTDEGQRGYGLINVNFYTPDIAAAVRRFEAAGYEMWSPPVLYDVSAHAGAPTEVKFDGPDTVVINLIELTTKDPATSIGRMRRYAEEYGYNAQGFTPVVTTQHTTPDRDAEIGFYREALGMGIRHMAILDEPGHNVFYRLPEGAVTLCAFSQGAHMFGKIGLDQPVNYPCPPQVDAAVAPNIGYIAQAFLVERLDVALAGAARADAKPYSPVSDVVFPGLGDVRAVMVRSPGSGALIALVEASD